MNGGQSCGPVMDSLLAACCAADVRVEPAADGGTVVVFSARSIELAVSDAVRHWRTIRKSSTPQQ